METTNRTNNNRKERQKGTTENIIEWNKIKFNKQQQKETTKIKLN